MIDWTDWNAKISKYFTVKEALFLPRWSRLAAAGDGLNENTYKALVELFEKMDLVRDFLGIPVLVHCAFRPERYNTEVGGAKNSAHIARLEQGNLIAAVDWHANVDGAEDIPHSCGIIKAAILPKLAEWNLRMEDNGPLPSWIHLDSKPVPPGGNRVFLP